MLFDDVVNADILREYYVSEFYTKGKLALSYVEQPLEMFEKLRLVFPQTRDGKLREMTFLAMLAQSKDGLERYRYSQKYTSTQWGRIMMLKRTIESKVEGLEYYSFVDDIHAALGVKPESKF